MTDVSAQNYRVCMPSAPMRATPHEDAECTSECLYGEWVQSAFTGDHSSADSRGGTPDTLARPTDNHDTPAQWLWVNAARDGYAGYMHASHLQCITTDTRASTHWVTARSTLVFSQPSIKSRVLMRLPFLSRVTSEGMVDSSFHRLSSGTYIWTQHLQETGTHMDATPVDLAKSHFLGAPYLWGGCSPAGLDCSGLIQALAVAKGINIPRDSGDQESALKNDVIIGHQRPQDIVYWPGHTGILLDAETLLHATAYSLSCTVEPLQDVVDRAGEISSIKRLFE